MVVVHCNLFLLPEDKSTRSTRELCYRFPAPATSQIPPFLAPGPGLSEPTRPRLKTPTRRAPHLPHSAIPWPFSPWLDPAQAISRSWKAYHQSIGTPAFERSGWVSAGPLLQMKPPLCQTQWHWNPNPSRLHWPSGFHVVPRPWQGFLHGYRAPPPRPRKMRPTTARRVDQMRWGHGQTARQWLLHHPGWWCFCIELHLTKVVLLVNWLLKKGA